MIEDGRIIDLLFLLMYKVYVGDTAVDCDDSGRPLSWGDEKVYYSGGMLDYIGGRKASRGNDGKVNSLGGDAVTRDSSGNITYIGGVPINGVLNLD